MDGEGNCGRERTHAPFQTSNAHHFAPVPAEALYAAVIGPGWGVCTV